MDAHLDITSDSSDSPIDQIIDELAFCDKHLADCVENEDWMEAQSVVKLRHQLLEKLSRCLGELKNSQQPDQEMAIRRKVKWTLEDLQDANHRYIDAIKSRISASQGQIRSLKRGRRAVSLYKSGQDKPPRFLNKVG